MSSDMSRYVLLHCEEQFEVGDERRGKLFQRNVADLVPLPDELRQVLVNDAVFQVVRKLLSLPTCFP